MTELQLRLWCLWMCEEFADLDTFFDEQDCAVEGADWNMAGMVFWLADQCGPLKAWELSERMP